MYIIKYIYADVNADENIAATARNRRRFQVNECKSRAVNRRVVGSSPTWGAIRKTAETTESFSGFHFARKGFFDSEGLKRSQPFLSLLRGGWPCFTL